MNEYKCPRISDLPTIDLYKEQVLDLIAPLLVSIDVKPITSHMINNYTKYKYIPAPIKKKYSQKHVAHIIVIAILKDIFELSEVNRAIQKSKSAFGFEEAFNLFMDSLETALNSVQNPDRLQEHLSQCLLHQETNLFAYAGLAFSLRKKARSILIEKGDINNE